MQHIMRTFLGDEVEEIIERDSRFSIANHDLRKKILNRVYAPRKENDIRH